MRIAFLVNSIDTESPHFATTVLAQEALVHGHDIRYLTPGDFVLGDDDRLAIHATVLPKSTYKKPETLHKDLVSDRATVETLDVDELDVLFLRNDPSQDAETRPWAAHAGTMFGRLATERGVLVVNDPDGLSLAQNKLYLQAFPEAVRPTALITRDIEEIRSFISAQPKGAIIKPMQGSGGRNVFKIESVANSNLNQIFEAVGEEGYLIAQSFMPEAKSGDVRVFLMNGEPLQRDGKFAALRRVPAKNEIRSNMHVKGQAVKVRMTDEILELAALVRPKLVADGMFLVGLDVVGDKLLEINVFTPGGLWSLGQMYETNFAASIIDSLEAKLEIRAAHRDSLSNRALATL